MITPRINIQRLSQRLNEVNKIGSLPGGGVSRPSLSDEDKRARDLLVRWATDLGLVTQVDEIGNIFCVWKGETDRIIGTGSHLDTVPTGGHYDGALGVVAALEALETLKEQNYQPKHTLALANFTNEEGTRFTPDMMGSLAYSNPSLVPSLLEAKAVDDQRTVCEELKRIGYAGSMKCGSISIDKFVELHIEQGPILENEKVDIGIVEGVQSIHWKKLSIHGKSAHAGTTPIALRKDAFYALSCLAVEAREMCRADNRLLITLGSVHVFPNVINVVPERVTATIDLRHPDDNHAAKAIEALSEFVKGDQAFKDLRTTWENLVDIKAVKFDASITGAIQKSCDGLGYSSRKMISGAGHDAQLLSSRVASAMIFVPSKNGVSHAVDEYSSGEQIEKGANVLMNSILELDRSQ